MIPAYAEYSVDHQVLLNRPHVFDVCAHAVLGVGETLNCCHLSQPITADLNTLNLPFLLIYRRNAPASKPAPRPRAQERGNRDAARLQRCGFIQRCGFTGHQRMFRFTNTSSIWTIVTNVTHLHSEYPAIMPCSAMYTRFREQILHNISCSLCTSQGPPPQPPVLLVLIDIPHGPTSTLSYTHL